MDGSIAHTFLASTLSTWEAGPRHRGVRMSARKVRRPQRSRASTELLAAIGEAVRQRRIELDMTQLELAEAADLHVVVVSRVENGQTPTLATVEALARALGERPSELLARAERLANKTGP